MVHKQVSIRSATTPSRAAGSAFRGRGGASSLGPFASANLWQSRRNTVLDFRQQLDQYEKDNRMPYITSIDRVAIEKGRKQTTQTNA